MKLPSDITAQELIKAMKKLGYKETRQSGSHIRLTTATNGEHHITVPNHKPLKTGTLSAIIADVALHFKKTKEEIIQVLFG